MEANDADTFTDAVKAFDKINHLDPWATTMLLKAKKKIAGVEIHEEGDLC